MGYNNGLLFWQMERVPGVVKCETFNKPIRRAEAAVSPLLGEVATLYLARIAETDARIEETERAKVQELGRRLTPKEFRSVHLGKGSGDVFPLDTTAFTRWFAERIQISEEQLRDTRPMRLYYHRHSIPLGRVGVDYQQMGDRVGVETTLARMSVGSRGVVSQSFMGSVLDITDAPGVAEALYEDAIAAVTPK